jgi:hypothetical protein
MMPDGVAAPRQPGPRSVGDVEGAPLGLAWSVRTGFKVAHRASFLSRTSRCRRDFHLVVGAEFVALSVAHPRPCVRFDCDSFHGYVLSWS